MPATKLQTTVRDHFRKLAVDDAWGVPALPAIVAYFRLFVDDEEELLLASRASADPREARAFGLSSKFVFVLSFRAPVENEEAQLQVEGSVLPRSAWSEVRFVDGSDAHRTAFQEAGARPVVEVVLDGHDEKVVIGGKDGLQFLPAFGPQADANWRSLFAELKRR